jgi:methylated-DNA-[protein]-cysteine S-methyltransferase
MTELESLLNRASDDATTDDAALARLRSTLADRAERVGLLDVAYRVVGSPVGDLLLAATPAGLVRVAYEREDHQRVLERIAAVVSPRVLHAPARLDAVARELDQYFAGRRTSFDLPLDHSLATSPFRRSVLAHLPEIGYGHTVSYAGIAARAGNPRAVRAAATACATNPLPVVVPCHRVVRSDGNPGDYVGGQEAKQTLLALERAGGR